MVQRQSQEGGDPFKDAGVELSTSPLLATSNLPLLMSCHWLLPLLQSLHMIAQSQRTTLLGEARTQRVATPGLGTCAGPQVLVSVVPASTLGSMSFWQMYFVYYLYLGCTTGGGSGSLYVVCVLCVVCILICIYRYHVSKQHFTFYQQQKRRMETQSK